MQRAQLFGVEIKVQKILVLQGKPFIHCFPHALFLTKNFFAIQIEYSENMCQQQVPSANSLITELRKMERLLPLCPTTRSKAFHSKEQQLRTMSSSESANSSEEMSPNDEDNRLTPISNKRKEIFEMDSWEESNSDCDV